MTCKFKLAIAKGMLQNTGYKQKACKSDITENDWNGKKEFGIRKVCN